MLKKKILFISLLCFNHVYTQSLDIYDFNIHEINVDEYKLGSDADASDNNSFYLGAFSGLSYQHGDDSFFLWTTTDKMKKSLLKLDIQPKGPKLVKLLLDVNDQYIKSVAIKSYHSLNFSPHLNFNLQTSEFIGDFKIDPEAVLFDLDTLWLVDEAIPSLHSFKLSDQESLEHKSMYTPNGFNIPHPNLNTRVFLPSFLTQAKRNAGFEAIASNDSSLFLFMQTAFDFDPISNKNFIRVVQLNKHTKHLEALYLYPLTHHDAYEISKISGATHLKDNRFLIIEQNSKKHERSYKSVVEVDFSNASNLLDLFSPEHPDLVSHQNISHLEQQLKTSEILHSFHYPTKKTILHFESELKNWINLENKKNASSFPAQQLTYLEKLEGIVFVKELNKVFLINDNDYAYDPQNNSKAEERNYLISFSYDPQ